MAHIQRKCATCRRTIAAGARSCPACGSRGIAYVARYRDPGNVERSKSFDRKITPENFLARSEGDKQAGA